MIAAAIGLPAVVALWFCTGYFFEPSEEVRRSYDRMKAEAGEFVHPSGATVDRSMGLIKSTWASRYLEVLGVPSFEVARSHYEAELAKRGWRLVETGTDVGDPLLVFSKQGMKLRMVYRGGRSGRVTIDMREDFKPGG